MLFLKYYLCIKIRLPISDTKLLLISKDYFFKVIQIPLSFAKTDHKKITHQWISTRTGGGEHLHRKVIRGCAAVMTPFFFRSVGVPQPTNLPSLPCSCVPIFIFYKKFAFSALFLGQNLSSQNPNLPSFHSQDPLFFKEYLLPRPYFWKPVQHTHTKKS